MCMLCQRVTATKIKPAKYFTNKNFPIYSSYTVSATGIYTSREVKNCYS